MADVNLAMARISVRIDSGLAAARSIRANRWRKAWPLRPQELDVREGAGDQHDVTRPVDAHIAAPRVPDRSFHVRSPVAELCPAKRAVTR